jgi:hypothetical protein
MHKPRDIHVVMKMLRKMASQNIPSWNRIVSWLLEMESLRKMLPEDSGSPLIVGD